MAKFNKWYYYLALTASAAAELSAGALMAFKPDVFFEDVTWQIIQLAGSFSVGAFTIGILSVVLMFYRKPAALVVGFTVLALYHAGIGIDQAVCGDEGPAAYIFHGILACSFVYFSIKAHKAQ